MDKFARNIVSYAIVGVGFFASTSALAVEARVYQLGDVGAFSPKLTFEIGNDNNPLRASAGSQEAMYVRVQPELQYIVQERNNRLVLGYTGDYYQYFEEYCLGNTLARPGDCPNGAQQFDKASYQDHVLSLTGTLEVTNRLRTKLELIREIDHVPMGTGQSAGPDVLGSLGSPDTWNNSIARAEFSFGADQARGEIQGGVTFKDTEYSSDNPGAGDQDESQVAPDIRLLYRIGTRTQIFAGYGRSETTGGDSPRIRNSYKVGAVFDPKGITSGSFTLSQDQESFSPLANRGALTSDFDYIGWDAEISWKPRDYSTLTIGGARESGRGYNGAVGIQTEIESSWNHSWNDRVSTVVGLKLDFDESFKRTFEEDTVTVTKSRDDSLELRLEGNYNLRRWLDVGGFAIINTRDAEEGRDFQRTVLGIKVNGTI